MILLCNIKILFFLLCSCIVYKIKTLITNFYSKCYNVSYRVKATDTLSIFVLSNIEIVELDEKAAHQAITFASPYTLMWVSIKSLFYLMHITIEKSPYAQLLLGKIVIDCEAN